ncbi:MAG TPA: zinc carboxypeptidase, partial [Chitinophagaceae bacterium]|nr:zinc carboxypeptidase [Chitinophagaceae bacterium]
IPYNSFNATQVMAQLLQQKVKLRYADKPFTYNGINYNSGTLIVLKAGNTPEWKSLVMQACKAFNVQPDAVESGFVDKGADFGSPYVRFIKPPRVALIAGTNISNTASGEVWNLFEQVLRYPITRIDAKYMDEISNDDFDVLIMPDGNYKTLSDKETKDALENFANRGGKIIALESAAVQIASLDWGFKLREIKKDSADSSNYSLLKKYADRERDAIKEFNPGAIYRVELDNTHPLAYGYPNYYYTLKMDANLYEFLKNGWNVGVVKKSSYQAGFTGSKLKSEIKDALLFGVQPHGDGNIILLADDVLFRLFWQNGKQLFCNAVFLVGQ